MKHCKGAALILVMWLLVLLIGVISIFAINARTEAMQGSHARLQTQLLYASQAGIEIAARRMLEIEPNRRLIADGRHTEFAFDQFEIQLSVRDESGKLDINIVDANTLRNFWMALGISAERAQLMSAAMIDWRDPDDLLQPEGGAEEAEYRAADKPYGCKNGPYESVAELQRVLGIEEEDLRAAMPYLTVYTGLAQANPAFADEAVLRAMGYPPEIVNKIMESRRSWQPGMPMPNIPGIPTLAANGTGTYSISSRASRADGPSLAIQAIIRVGSGSYLGQFYTPLAWEIGEQE